MKLLKFVLLMGVPGLMKPMEVKVQNKFEEQKKNKTSLMKPVLKTVGWSLPAGTAGLSGLGGLLFLLSGKIIKNGIGELKPTHEGSGLEIGSFTITVGMLLAASYYCFKKAQAAYPEAKRILEKK